MKVGVIVLVFVFSLSLVAAGYSIDISGLEQEPYSIGEEIIFKVLLLEDGQQISDDVEVVLLDDFGKKQIKKMIRSNEDFSVLVEEDFPSLGWVVRASYNDVEVERNFLVQENTDVEFLIEEDKLIIKNTGNVRYTRTISIKIGGSLQTLAQNIKVGGQKELKLIAPEGLYDIEISDGENKFSKKNVQLFGTGNAIGAIDPNIQGTGFLGGPVDPDKMDEGFISLDKLPIAIVFIAAVFGLGILLLIEKRVRKKS